MSMWCVCARACAAAPLSAPLSSVTTTRQFLCRHIREREAQSTVYAERERGKANVTLTLVSAAAGAARVCRLRAGGAAPARQMYTIPEV